MPNYVRSNPWLQEGGQIGTSIAETLAQSLIKLPMLRLQLAQQQQDREAAAQRAAANDQFRRDEFTQRKHEFDQREADSQRNFKAQQGQREQSRLAVVNRIRQAAQDRDIKGAQWRLTQKNKTAEDAETVRHHQAMENKQSPPKPDRLNATAQSELQRAISSGTDVETAKKNVQAGLDAARQFGQPPPPPFVAKPNPAPILDAGSFWSNPLKNAVASLAVPFTGRPPAQPVVGDYAGPRVPGAYTPPSVMLQQAAQAQIPQQIPTPQATNFVPQMKKWLWTPQGLVPQ